jgi:hypothetical protein
MGATLTHLDEKDLAHLPSHRDEAALAVARAEGQAVALEKALVYAATPNTLTRVVNYYR